MVCTELGTTGMDTLAPLKDVYLNFRRARDGDCLSEDIVAAIVPGVAAHTPRNEYLGAAWRSLKSLGNKHVGPRLNRLRKTSRRS